MATPTPAPGPQLSLISVVIARLAQLKAIVPSLRELPQQRLDELWSLLDRAHKLVEEYTAPPIASASESAHKPQATSDS
jgi:hypothetical protein